jgi:hypothetical protein
MNINLPSGPVSLDEDAIPSLTLQRDIIASLTRHEGFQALCDASAQWPELTNWEFFMACQEWISTHRSTEVDD